MPSTSQQLTENLPLLAGAVNLPTLHMITLLALAAGAVVDSPYLIANGANILGELGAFEQMGIRAILAFALWKLWERLNKNQEAALKRLTDENERLIEELHRLQKREENRHDKQDETRS